MQIGHLIIAHHFGQLALDERGFLSEICGQFGLYSSLDNFSLPTTETYQFGVHIAWRSYRFGNHIAWPIFSQMDKCEKGEQHNFLKNDQIFTIFCSFVVNGIISKKYN